MHGKLQALTQVKGGIPRTVQANQAPEWWARARKSRRTIESGHESRPSGHLSIFIVALATVISPLRLSSPQSQTPTEVFQAYRSTLAKATSFNELLPFMDAKGRGMIEPLPKHSAPGCST